jgi:hypothetical protein
MVCVPKFRENLLSQIQRRQRVVMQSCGIVSADAFTYKGKRDILMVLKEHTFLHASSSSSRYKWNHQKLVQLQLQLEQSS